MNKETKTEISKMMSLIERMDKHYTNRESNVIISQKLIKEGLEEINRADEINDENGNVIKLNSPSNLIKALSTKGISPAKAWYVTIGCVTNYTKLGKKNIRPAVDSFNQEDIDNARSLNSPWLNNMIDNPIMNKRGQISNPYMIDSYSNFIAEVSLVRLMYGRNEEYGIQKQNVINALKKYQQDNPENVKHYMNSKGITNFSGEGYQEREFNSTRISGTNAKQNTDGSYQLDFNTPKGAFKQLKKLYFIITDENTIKPISEAEAEAYARLYGTETAHKAPNPDAVIAKIDDDIRKIKAQYHEGDIWTNYGLDSVFLLNFSTKENSDVKLQYFNPNAIVRFVKGRTLKGGNVNARMTSPGVFKDTFYQLKEFEE